jgi:hypothetical protein
VLFIILWPLLFVGLERRIIHEESKTMTYLFEWKGSSEPENKSGVADFAVEGKHYILSLEKFDDALAISLMLQSAFDQGKDCASRVVLREARVAARDMGADV